MIPLHRLPNGEWIDLLVVNFVSAHRRRSDEPQSVDRVIIMFNSDMSLMVSFADFTSAQSYADELAALVNAARQRANAGGDLADASDASRADRTSAQSDDQVGEY